MVALDGTKIHANAGRHHALSYGRICKIEAQLKTEVAELLLLAEQADAVDEQGGMSVPEELSRQKDCVECINESTATVETRAETRDERKQAEYDEKMTECKEKVEERGHKLGGRPLQPPKLGPVAKDQINLTDPDSRIMPVSGGSFVQGYNAQIMAATGSLLVLINHVVQAMGDKQQMESAL